MAGAKATQTRRRESAKQRELAQQKQDALNHIAALDAQAQQLQAQAMQIDAARQQMLGRLRLIQEQLGEVEPLAAAPQPPEPELEPDDQPNGDGG